MTRDPIEVMARALVEETKKRDRRSLTSYYRDDDTLDTISPGRRASFIADAKAALSALEDEGWQVVPTEPNDAMIMAMVSSINKWLDEDPDDETTIGDAYRAALAAAPKHGGEHGEA